MIINVSFDGRKLFSWEGGIAEATKIEKDVSEVAALGNMSPETLWQSTLAKIAANGPHRRCVVSDWYQPAESAR